MEAFLKALAVHLPDKIITNQQLHDENPNWDIARIQSKTGIESRHIASDSESAGDLAFAAGSKLIQAAGIDPSAIDYLLYCTQSPDHVLPGTSCILQHRLGLSRECGTLDFNQGCSGYVYGLNLARALLMSRSAQNILFLTSETYSKYIDPRDRTVRVLFGDAASASLISSSAPGAKISVACLGTDGSGASNLMVSQDSASEPDVCRFPKGKLTMNGDQLFAFAMREVPALVRRTLTKLDLTSDEVHWFVFHQANAFMNLRLGERLHIESARMPIFVKDVGNTVSNTIPLTIWKYHDQFKTRDKVMLVGFGVGYSWGACVLDWAPIQAI